MKPIIQSRGDLDLLNRYIQDGNATKQGVEHAAQTLSDRGKSPTVDAVISFLKKASKKSTRSLKPKKKQSMLHPWPIIKNDLDHDLLNWLMLEKELKPQDVSELVKLLMGANERVFVSTILKHYGLSMKEAKEIRANGLDVI